MLAPTENLDLITLPITTPWNYCSPHLFRYLESKYVDEFFIDGSLRLSSFEQFRKHVDEERLDTNEGKTLFVSRTRANGGQTIEAHAKHGNRAYVLCTTMKFDKTVQGNFSADSYIRIGDSTNFGIEVSRQIPGLIAGFEGPCLYQDKRIIEQDLGYVDPEWLRGPSTTPTPSGTRLEEFLLSRMGHLPFFLKEGTFSHQVEYRYVWIVNYEPSGYLDLKVPNAIVHCQRPNDLTK